MITDPLAADHGALSDALAGVIEALRTYPGVAVGEGMVAGPAGRSSTIESQVEGFVKHLAEHMREEEDVLFPALLAVSPEAEPEIEQLAEEHWPIHLTAREFSVRFTSGDVEGACRVARVFLAELLSHVGHETRVIRRILDSAGPEALRGTENLFFEWRVRSTAAELAPLLREWDSTLEIVEARDGVVSVQVGPDAPSRRPLQTQISRFLKARIPDVLRVEFEDAHPGGR
ncbi:MAG: hemerythrin domain-containing protein [Planctomycetes bacterium]|nr:hemerythrin domain-containing protein [Planctomycetota bacterium]